MYQKKKQSPPLSPEKIELFEKRFEEGYDVDDSEYRVWLKLYHTESVTSSGCLRASSSSSDTSPVLSEILSLPKPPERKKKSATKQAICITEDQVLRDMKEKAAEKAAKESKIKNKGERERTTKGREGSDKTWTKGEE